MVEMPRTESFQQAAEVSHDGTAASEQPAKSTPVPVRAKIKRAALAFALLAGTALAWYYGHHYWTTGR